MTPERYLALIEQDGRRLADAAAAGPLDAPIPTCPGWDVRTCVDHTAGVYRNRIAGILLQRRPGPGEVEERPPDGDLVPWFSASLDALLDVLREHGPDAPAYTWWPPDQTVGFWYRRMAQETAVHRLDVEDGRGTPTPIDAALAVDGIDEVLDLFLGDDWATMDPKEWDGVDPQTGAGATVAVRSGGAVWRSTLRPDAIELQRSDGPADAGVAGDPEAVLLWLWGRRPDDVVTLDGDPAVLTAYRDRLRIATQ
jgi:uncharacterized protein (TIGR03083 family)